MCVWHRHHKEIEFHNIFSKKLNKIVVHLRRLKCGQIVNILGEDNIDIKRECRYVRGWQQHCAISSVSHDTLLMRCTDVYYSKEMNVIRSRRNVNIGDWMLIIDLLLLKVQGATEAPSLKEIAVFRPVESPGAVHLAYRLKYTLYLI